ncbi:hypothetical protein L1887_14524 [Cichorium endivia]|nr:hypothetical protein L1887_14524 [Cichorium endivia]
MAIRTGQDIKVIVGLQESLSGGNRWSHQSNGYAASQRSLSVIQFTMAYAYWKAGKHKERAVDPPDRDFRRSKKKSEASGVGGNIKLKASHSVELLSIPQFGFQDRVLIWKMELAG